METDASHFLLFRLLEVSAKKELKKTQKTCKKVLTRKVRCGIIYKSTRYGTEVPRSLDEIDEEKLLRFEQTQDLRTR